MHINDYCLQGQGLRKHHFFGEQWGNFGIGLHISEKFTPHQMVKTANKFFYWLLKYHKVQSSSITIQHGARRKDFSVEI